MTRSYMYLYSVDLYSKTLNLGMHMQVLKIIREILPPCVTSFVTIQEDDDTLMIFFTSFGVNTKHNYYLYINNAPLLYKSLSNNNQTFYI